MGLAAAILASGVMSSCGLSKDRPQLNEGASLTNQETLPCNEKECPVAPLQIASSHGNAGMAFKVGEVNRVTISATARFAPDRVVGIQKLSGLKDCQWSGLGSPKADCTWMPEMVGEEGTVTFLLRDISRCVHLLKPKGHDAYCSDFTRDMSQKNTGMTIEVELEMPWTVIDSDVSKLDQGFFQQQSAKKGANAGLSGCAASGLAGLLSGGWVGAIFGCVGGAIMPLGQEEQPLMNPNNMNNPYGTQVDPYANSRQ